jgi:branched-chain amino acid transport system permease protein
MTHLAEWVSRAWRAGAGGGGRAARAIPRKAAAAALIVFLLVLPQVHRDEFLFRILAMIGIWSILGLGQNVITGFCGQLSFGHAAFYGIGAYTSVLLTIHFGLPYLIALGASALAAGLFGLVVGYPAIRVGGDYLFLVTIGFAEIVRLVFLNWDDLTGGPIGIPNVPPATIFDFQLVTNTHYYYLAWALLGVIVWVLSRLIDSDVGRSFQAIREDEVAARAMGINLTYYKLLAFSIGAALGGVAGSVVAHFLAYVGADMFTIWESTLVFEIVLVGGLGSLAGTILGAALLVGAFESSRWLIDYRMYLAGVLLLGTVLLRPSGLIGTVRLRAPDAAGGARMPIEGEEAGDGPIAAGDGAGSTPTRRADGGEWVGR